MKRLARISRDGVYRYWLSRHWGDGAEYKPLCFIMLNPSAAGALLDDPTVRKCVGFAQRLGFNGIDIRNLFALRATNPKELQRHVDPVGPENEGYLSALNDAPIVVAAWGTKGALNGRAREVCGRFLAAGSLRCLGTTKDGYPRHPLYVRYLNSSGRTKLLPYTCPD